MRRNGKIVVVGSSNTDMVVKVPALPRPGETVLGGAFYRAAGGKGANQAVAAARAGGDVVLVAAVGSDDLGREAVEGFAAQGIDTGSIVEIQGAPSGVALILVDAAGENSIAVASGANGLLGPDRIREVEAVLSTASVVVLQLEVPLESVAEAVRIASQGGASVILNPAPAAPLPDELLRRVTVLTPNQPEAELLTGIKPSDPPAREAAASELLARGVGAVVITLGADGAFVATSEGSEMVPGWEVVVEDTTGAGDVFNGALAAALAEGKSLSRAVRFANAAAALSVTRRGAQPSAPTRAEILATLSRPSAP